MYSSFGQTLPQKTESLWAKKKDNISLNIHIFISFSLNLKNSNMTNWKGIRTLMRKYGISQKEMLRILETHEVVYSDAAGVILVDEDSLMAYIDALKQLTQKDSLVNVLQKALRSKKK